MEDSQSLLGVLQRYQAAGACGHQHNHGFILSTTTRVEPLWMPKKSGENKQR